MKRKRYVCEKSSTCLKMNCPGKMPRLTCGVRMTALTYEFFRDPGSCYHNDHLGAEYVECGIVPYTQEEYVKQARAFLIGICLEKKLLLERNYGVTEPVYVTDDDIGDINSWMDVIVLKIAQEIAQYAASVRPGMEIWDGRFCPWCINYLGLASSSTRSMCFPCSYGKRHGRCNSESANYMKLRNKVSAHQQISEAIRDPFVSLVKISGKIFTWDKPTN